MVVLNLKGLTQTSGDRIPDADLKRVLIAAEEGKIAKKQVALYEKQVATLEERVQGLQLIIKTHNDKDKAQSLLIETYKAQVTSYEESIKIYKAAIADLEKKIKKERTKRFVTMLGGIAGVIVTAFVFSQ